MKVVLSGVDAGAWSLVALQVILERCGHDVVNLGARRPLERVLQACRERPDCVVLSASDGGADCARVITRVRADPALTRLPTVIAGRLDLPRRELLALGFDEAFPATTDAPGQAVVALRLYLGRVVVGVFGGV
ncbi:MAG: methylaspartate mutase sigma subunit [Actinomycetota bacterium]|nr:methylaspartate mutase sigma subunit [Actinomycetota bacterium]